VGTLYSEAGGGAQVSHGSIFCAGGTVFPRQIFLPAPCGNDRIAAGEAPG